MSRSLQELRENAAKGVETCWVIELHQNQRQQQYLSWDPCSEQVVVWVDEWDRALKLYDRASAEILCAEMPFEWDVRIMEHQMVFPLDEEADRG